MTTFLAILCCWMAYLHLKLFAVMHETNKGFERVISRMQALSKIVQTIGEDIYRDKDSS